MYESLLQSHSGEGQLNKEGSLQLRFDIRFLFGVLFFRFDSSPLLPHCRSLLHQLEEFGFPIELSTDSAQVKQVYQDVLGDLQRRMDVIDFAFYEPFLLSAVERSLCGVRVLFGLLFDSFTSPSPAAAHPSLGSQDTRSNIVALATPPPRFSLLPTNGLQSTIQVIAFRMRI
jgi:hypothetical protein